MTAPALAPAATSGCPPWCDDHYGDGFHSTTVATIYGADPRHELKVKVEQVDTTEPIVSILGGDIELSLPGLLELAAASQTAADLIAQARR